MQKKSLLVILLTTLIFLSACVLGVSTVYRVDEVTVRAATLSSQAETEAEQLKNRLLESYEKESMFFVDDEAAQTVLAEFPYFRLTSIEKAYPNRLIFNVSEDEEVYAVATQSGDGYYILNAEGTILSVREDYINRKETDENAKNVLISGLTLQGEKGGTLTGDECFEYVFAFLKQADNLLGGARRNLTEVQFIRGGSSPSTFVLKIKTIEGVTIYVRNPGSMTQKKAESAITKYLNLDDGAHTKGMLVVYEQDENVVTMYSSSDNFDEN